MNREQFILKARQVHGWKYDYSKVSLTKVHDYICIICPEHGEFKQRANHHLAGHGCKECGKIANAMARRISFDEFVRKAKEVHGDKYIYHRDSYADFTHETMIKCPQGHTFMQKPTCHVNQEQGCPVCAGVFPISKEEFIYRMINKFGDKFDLSGINYIDYKTPIDYVCDKGHQVHQTPYNIMNSKYGCPVCAEKERVNHVTFTTEDFISRAKIIHGDKYDYTPSIYRGMRETLIIRCPKHGNFEQEPMNHLQGCGCQKCGKENASEMIRGTLEDFVTKARAVHGDRYSYDNAIYNKSHTPICITCAVHGDFWQDPSNHLNGSGCPKCYHSKGENRISKWLDAKGISYKTQYQISLDLKLFSRNKLRVDFYIHSINTIIEFHGEQHYKFLPFFHRCEDDFLVQQDRDKRLRNYCRTHKIRLIEIKFDDMDRIEHILERKLKWMQN